MAALLSTYTLPVALFAILTASVVLVSINFTVANRVVGLPVHELAGCFVRPLGASLIMVLVEAFLMHWWPLNESGWKLLPHTFTYVAVGVVTFVGALLFLWRGAGTPDGAERLVLARVPGRRVASWLREQRVDGATK